MQASNGDEAKIELRTGAVYFGGSSAFGVRTCLDGTTIQHAVPMLDKRSMVLMIDLPEPEQDGIMRVAAHELSTIAGPSKQPPLCAKWLGDILLDPARTSIRVEGDAPYAGLRLGSFNKMVHANKIPGLTSDALGLSREAKLQLADGLHGKP